MKNYKLLSISLYILIFLLIILSALNGQYSRETNTVTISVIENDYIHNLIKNIINTAYGKIGLKVKFFELPARRSLEWANIGKTDGDLARIDKTDQKYKNLIKIPVPIFTIKGVVFTKKIKRDIRKWEDLKGLEIGIRRGIIYNETGCRDLNCVKVMDLHDLFTLLSEDRIDVAVADYNMGKYEIAKNFKRSNIHIIGHPLNSAYLFHYINKKNKELSVQLEKVLQNMMESGESDALLKRATQEILPE